MGPVPNGQLPGGLDLRYGCRRTTHDEPSAGYERDLAFVREKGRVTMSDAVWVRGYYGDQFVLVDGTEVFELRTEAEARRFLEELGEKAIEPGSVSP